MTLLEIAKNVSIETGVEIPASIQNDDPFSLKIVRFINETGIELARRVDWHVLNKRYEIVGDGSSRDFDLPNDYARLARGLSVSVNGALIRGSLSADEWFSLTFSQGTPRYFRSSSSQISLYPYPPSAQSIFVSYQSSNWAQDINEGGKAQMSTDSDVPLLPVALFERGAVWRWMRHVGRDYADHMAEYEAMLADYSQHEGGIRQP